MRAGEPSRIDNLRTLRNANLDMAFSTSFLTLTTGAFLVGFVQLLGGSDAWIGMLSAIPSLVGLLQIPGAIWGRRFSSYKKFVTPGGALWRLLMVPIMFLPILALPNEFRLITLAVLVTIASAAVTIVNPIYSDWLAEMIPANSRGWFFSRRNAIGASVGAVAGIIGATILDAFRSYRMDAIGFTVVFGIGMVFAGFSMFYYLKMTDIPRVAPVRQNLLQGIRSIGAPFSDRKFRGVLILLTLAITGQTLPGNLFAAFARETLELNFKIIQGTAVFMAIGNVLAAPFWGYFSDKFGNKPVLTLSLLMLSLNPIPWILCQPNQDTYNAVLLLSTHVIMGITWAAVALTQFNLVLATAKPEDRANYLAAGMTVMAVVGGVAPLVGAGMMAELRHHFPVETAYKIVFGMAGIIRILSALSVLPIQEPGAQGFRATIRELRNVTPGRLRTIRRMAGGASAEHREQAIQNAADQGMTIASDEILAALHDPLPRVRRRAAVAAAKLTDPRAVAELIHQIEAHPDLVEEEMIESLGLLGDPRAVTVLTQLLESPRSSLRRAAAKALGRIEHHDPAARAALCRVATAPTDPDLRRAALQALRLDGDPSGFPAFLAGLMDEHPSVRIAAAEGVAELAIPAADVCRNSLTTYQDEACAEVAYALAAVGRRDDVPRILDEAARSTSNITRKRCLLGVARLFDVDRAVYRLLSLEGMARDQALVAMLPSSVAGKAALREFSRGDEAAAIRILGRTEPQLLPLVATEVQERFLVAAAVFAGR